MLFKRPLKKMINSFLTLVIVSTLFNLPAIPASTAHAAEGDHSDLLGIVVNKPAHAVVNPDLATIDIALPYGTLYQMLNVTTNPGAAAALYRSNGTTAISFAASGINKGDAKLDQFSPDGTTLYYLKVTDKSNGTNSKTYTIKVSVDPVPSPPAGTVGANDKYSPLNIHAGEHAWDVMGASKIGRGSTTGSVEGPGVPSSYSGKAWYESVYDRNGDYPLASTVNASWLGDNMYLQTIGKNDLPALAKYGVAGVPGTDKLNSDILRFHEFDPFVTPDGVSRDDGDRGAVGSDRQRLEIKSNTGTSNIDANSVGGDIMTNHWRLMLPSETLRYQKDVGDKHAGDFIVPHRFWHIFQMKEIAGNAAGQPVATLSLVSSEGKGQLEFRNNPDGSYADRIKPLFTIPFEKIVDRWLDFDVTILTADSGYIYGKLVDLESGEVLFEGGMTAETYRRPEAANPDTGRLERSDLPAANGQQNRSKWGLYRGMYNGPGDAEYADEFQNATMYLSDVYLIKRDKNSYVFPDGWDPKAQPKNVAAWARPAAITAYKGAPFGSLPLPAQLDVTLSTGNTEKVNVMWSSADYDSNQTGTFKIYGDFAGSGITNTKNIRPYIEVTLQDVRPPSVNLLDPSRFTPQAGVNLKVSSETGDHPGADALKTKGSGYWRNSSSNVYKTDYSPSSLAFSLDLGASKTIDKLYLEIPNTISNIQENATRFEVYYSNSPDSWASAPTASDTATDYDWRANGWTLAGGTETEGLWSYVTYNGQSWGYDTKTFLFPFTARYIMINTVLVGPRDRRADDANAVMGLSGLAIYGKDPVSNETALTPAKSTYSTWDQTAPVTASINLAAGQLLTGISKGDTALRPDADYSLAGNTVTFSPAYLAKLPLGTNEFTFYFNNGAPSVFALDVTARGYGENGKTIKMNAIEGVSPYNILGGAMGTDEPVEGVTKRIRNAYHEFYGDQPRATAADDHIKGVWDSALQKYVFEVMEYGRGVNNEYLDKVRDGEYGHKGNFDPSVGYITGGAAYNDRQRIEIRPSEDSTGDFVAHEGDLVSYEWLWNIPDGSQWNQPNFRHIFQLKAVNAQAADTLPGGNSGGENGAYILAMSISGTTARNLVVNHNRYDGDKNLMTIPLKDIDGHWIKVELKALISDTGWLTVKITDTVTGKVYTFDSPDVYKVFPNQGAGDGVKDLWRRPERSGGFETEYPAAFDQYLRPKWGIYRSSNGSTNSAYDVRLKLADITISKLASGIPAVNLALNKKAYNVGPTEGANPIQLQSATANVYGNADKLTTGVLQDPTKWNVTNVTGLEQIGHYSWLGTDGARKGSFVVDLGRDMDFSQIRLFAKSTRLKGVTVYVSEDFGNHSSAAEFDAMAFKQVDKRTSEGYTFATGNNDGGTDSEDSSYPIDLGKTYHSRYIKVTVENASGGNAGTDLTGPPRLTQVQVFNAPSPPQHLRVETAGSAAVLKWDAGGSGEGYIVNNGTAVLAELPETATSCVLPADITDVSQIAVRTKGTDPYSRKFMLSAPALPAVAPIPAIVSLTPVSVTTKAGTAPVLPSVVTAVYSDNTTNQVPVLWDAIDPAKYASPGSFSVQGTVTGTTYKALANVTVTESPKADASIVYTGPSSSVGAKTTLTAVIREQTSGGPGKLGGLPITFDVKKLQTDGAAVPYRSESVTTDVYGGASLVASLPAGLYEVSAGLDANPYYKETAVKSTLAVNADKTGSLQVAGNIDAPVPPGIFGAKAKKIHIEGQWYMLNGKPLGLAAIHAEPQGLRLFMKQPDWIVTAGTSAFVQGSAWNEQGIEYTVRLAMDTAKGKAGKSSVLSVVIWKGGAAEGTPVAEVWGQKFSGSIQIR
ncbi:Ig-like domain-containing protein [Paenibacillus hamazuiensis]|uniref:Ig-like domain-containing protein n=1 Tax=Paenibacillus hamazuiensis TaxID=2936508 RepID=UPI00200BCD7F|nr:Ig-like domain-containing protein [Paenibacillus hamazuiensis]